MNRIFLNISTFVYTVAAFTLVVISMLIIGWSIYEIVINLKDFSINKEFIIIMLQAVGAIVIATAIVDVAKYMIEEEVLKDKELSDPEEARRTLTKIMTIISITVSIEGIIYIFKAGLKDLSLLVYPSLLIITSMIIIVGMAYYQKLNIKE